MRDHFANVTLGAGGGMDHTKETCPYSEDVVFELMGGVQWVAHREYHPNETPAKTAEQCAVS
jgi:hypothetical protein